MELGGHIQIPGYRMCGFQKWFGWFGKAQSLFTLLGFDPRLLHHTAISLASINDILTHINYWQVIQDV
jgi:hypothetical protein